MSTGFLADFTIERDGELRHITAMAKKLEYPNNIKNIREQRGLTMQGLADLLGTDASTVSKLEKGKTKLSEIWLRRLSDALEVNVDELMKPYIATVQPERMTRPIQPSPRRTKSSHDGFTGTGLLPVYGFAAGSIVGEEQILTNVIDEIPSPPALQHVRGAYALLTRNTSMAPRYLPNETLYVHPHQAIRPGDHVIIQGQLKEDGPLETWVKRYDSETEHEIFASQYNPPAKIAYKKKFIRAIHRVLPTSELF